MCMLTVVDPKDDIETVVVSNVSTRDTISPPDVIAFADKKIPSSMQVAIADSGAMQIFIMDGTPVKNKLINENKNEQQ